MQKLTEGNISRQIITFSIPLLLGATLQRGYTLVDTIMVGQLLGPAPLAAVGSISNICIMLTFLCNGLTMGFAIVAGQKYGAGNMPALRKTLAHTYLLSFLLVAAMTATGLAFKEKILIWTKIPESIHDLALGYLEISVRGLFTAMLYNLLADLLRTLGDSVIPLVFLTVSVSLNIFLDWVFIGKLGFGVRGAALATVIAQGISGLSCLVFCIFRRPLLKVSAGDFSFKDNTLAEMIPQGLSMSLMISVVNAGTIILQTGINSLGEAIIAGHTAGRKYIEFFLMPGGALSSTAAAFTSQNFGAREYGRIKKGTRQMVLFAFAVDLLELVAVYLFAEQMVVSITGRNVQKEIIETGVFYLKTNLPFYFFVSVLVIVRNVLQGMNKKKTPVIASLMELGVKVLAVMILVPKLGYTGIAVSEPIIWILGALWVFPVYRMTINRKIREAALN